MTKLEWMGMRGSHWSGRSICLLLVFSIPTVLASARLFDTAAVPDDVLDELRGGFFTETGQEISFAVTRTVAIDGQVMLRQTMVLNNIPALLSQAVPGTESGAGGTLAVVQNGLGNAVDAANKALVSQSQQPAAGAIQTAPATPAAPTISGPTTAAVVTAPSVPPAAHATAASSIAPSTPAAATPVAPAGDSAAVKIQIQPPSEGSVTTQQAAKGDASLTTQIEAGGRVIVLPNGPAMAAAIQNSVNNTRIQVATDINVTVASLSQLGALLRQQAMTAAHTR